MNLVECRFKEIRAWVFDVSNYRDSWEVGGRSRGRSRIATCGKWRSGEIAVYPCGRATRPISPIEKVQTVILYATTRVMQQPRGYLPILLAIASAGVATTTHLFILGALWLRAYTIGESIAILGLYVITPVASLIAFASSIVALFAVRSGAPEAAQ